MSGWPQTPRPIGFPTLLNVLSAARLHGTEVKAMRESNEAVERALFNYKAALAHRLAAEAKQRGANNGGGQAEVVEAKKKEETALATYNRLAGL